MKYTWELQDVAPGRVVRSKSPAANNKCILARDVHANWSVVSLTDGLVVYGGTVSMHDVCNWLNSTGHQPTDDDRETVAAADWLAGRRRG